MKFLTFQILVASNLHKIAFIGFKKSSCLRMQIWNFWLYFTKRRLFCCMETCKKWRNEATKIFKSWFLRFCIKLHSLVLKKFISGYVSLYYLQYVYVDLHLFVFVYVCLHFVFVCLCLKIESIGFDNLNHYKVMILSLNDTNINNDRQK